MLSFISRSFANKHSNETNADMNTVGGIMLVLISVLYYPCDCTFFYLCVPLSCFSGVQLLLRPPVPPCQSPGVCHSGHRCLFLDVCLPCGCRRRALCVLSQCLSPPRDSCLFGFCFVLLIITITFFFTQASWVLVSNLGFHFIIQIKLNKSVIDHVKILLSWFSVDSITQICLPVQIFFPPFCLLHYFLLKLLDLQPNYKHNMHPWIIWPLKIKQNKKRIHQEKKWPKYLLIKLFSVSYLLFLHSSW